MYFSVSTFELLVEQKLLNLKTGVEIDLSAVKSKKLNKKLATHQHWLLICDFTTSYVYHDHNNNL